MKKRIFYKLIFAVGIPTVAAIVIYSYISINSQYTQLISQMTRGVDQLSETIKSSTKQDMLSKDRPRVHAIIDTIGQQEGIEKVRIFNKEGRIIFSSNKGEMLRMVDKKAEACYACHTENQPLESLAMSKRSRIFEGPDGVRRMGIINPIYNEPGCWQAACHAHTQGQSVLGVLDMTVSLKDVDQGMAENRYRMIVFAFSLIVLVSLILWFVVKKLIGVPVAKLVDATNVVAEGNLAYKISMETNDELGNLAKSFNDMTARLAEAQEQIYRQDKLASLGRLAAGVAHELNNPLTGVLTYGSFLLKRTQEGDDSRKDLDVIVREAKRCREIVKSLLDFARQNPSKKRKVCLNRVIEQSLQIIDNQITINNVLLEKSLAHDLPEVYADPNRMQQVMLNVLVNALDAMESSGGTLTISTAAQVSAEGKCVRIRIVDTGCGMSREQMNKIFDPFYTTKGQKGTGLGLAVVWGIIHDHGGTLAVESEPGQGTAFIITIPSNGGDSKAKELYENPL